MSRSNGWSSMSLVNIGDTRILILDRAPTTHHQLSDAQHLAAGIGRLASNPPMV